MEQAERVANHLRELREAAGPAKEEEFRERAIGEVRNLVEKLHRALHEAEERGEEELAKGLRERLEGAERKLAELTHDAQDRRLFDSQPPHHPPELEQIMRRIEHLHRAAENLQIAGEHELAEKLHREAEENERELHRQREHGPEGGPPEELVREVLHQLEAMRNEVRELREEVRELREFLQRR